MTKKELEQEKEEEVEEETAEEEEEEVEDDSEEVKNLSNILEKKLEKVFKSIKENPVKKSYSYKEEVTNEKSVLEADPYLRKIRPFVKLSPKMEKFVEGVRAIAKGDVNAIQKSALNEGDDTAGGFTVPEEFNSEVIRYETENSIVRPRARVWNMTRDRWTAPKLDQNTTTDADNTGAEHFAGIYFYYPAESELKTESEPRFGRITLVAKKLIGLTAATDELLEDSAINLANYLVSLFGEGLGYFEDYKFLRGSGHNEPLGIINASGVNVVTRQTSSRIVLNDVLGLDKNLPAWADKNAVWLMTKAAREQLMLIGNETTAIIRLQDNLRDAYSQTLLGKPVVLTDKLPSVGTPGDIMLCDFSKYFIGDRGAIQVASSIHDRFRYDETVFRLVKRHDGLPAIPKAFALLRE